MGHSMNTCHVVLQKLLLAANSPLEFLAAPAEVDAPPDLAAPLAGWNQVGETVAFGTLNPAALTADITTEAEITKLENLLADKRSQRDLAYSTMWDKIKRIRAGVKANFGDDSQQFEWVGGTRTSERKRATGRVIEA